MPDDRSANLPNASSGEHADEPVDMEPVGPGTSPGRRPSEAIPSAFSKDRLSRALEAVLITLDRPVDAVEVADALGIEPVDVVAALHDLAARYESARHGFALRETASGWRYAAVPEMHELLARVVQGEQTVRLSNAALETLAVVAYQQPVSRSRVAAVRGVNVDAVVRTLTARGLIQEVTMDESTGAVLYGTTSHFLDRLGIASLSELPELAPLLPDVGTVGEIHDALST